MSLNTIGGLLVLVVLLAGYLGLTTASTPALVAAAVALLGLTATLAVASVRSPLMRRRLERDD